MNFKPFFSLRGANEPVRPGTDSDAGVIVFLMMALVFVPIVVAHVAVAWPGALAPIGPQQLATALGTLLHGLN